MGDIKKDTSLKSIKNIYLEPIFYKQNMTCSNKYL